MRTLKVLFLEEPTNRDAAEKGLVIAIRKTPKAAKWLGVSRPTMRKKLLRYGVHPRLESLPHRPLDLSVLNLAMTYALRVLLRSDQQTRRTPTAFSRKAQGCARNERYPG